jgi:putative ABC transport system permease protein
VFLNEEVVGNARQTLYVLFATVALVLLIACANAANLMVARANARRREIVIRQALGAGRGRIARQIITESLLLSLVAGAAGVVLAYWGLDLLLATWPGSLPRVHDVGIDRSVLLFTLGISLLTGLGFGIIPAIRASNPAIEEALRESSAGVGASRRRHRSLRIMVGAQLAIALVLLVGAGLLVRSFVRLLEVDPGYDTSNVLAARIRLTPSRFPDPTAKQEFFRQVIEGLAARPEVTGVTSSRTLPLSGAMMMLGIQPRDIRPDDPEPFLPVAMRLVGPDYFSTLRIPITRGRPFEATDRSGAPAVIIVNDRLAKRLWPNEDPLGKRFPMDFPDRGAYDATVVGVVGDIRYSGLNDEIRPEIYIPQAQTTDGAGQSWVIVRAARNPLALAGMLRDVVRRADATTPIADLVSLEQLIGRTTAARRFNMTVVTLFAGLAFLLAVIGVYGVTSYAVSQRTREVGLRMALGAQRRDVTRMVLGEGIALALIGVAVGMIGAFAASRAIASMLFDVTATDLPTFVGTAALLIAAAGLATYIPARRAARVDPMIALRSE